MTRLVRSPVAALRVACGLETAAQGAVALDCSRAHLLAIERGRGGPSAELFSAMCLRYGCTHEQLQGALVKAQRELRRRELRMMRTKH